MTWVEFACIAQMGLGITIALSIVLIILGFVVTSVFSAGGAIKGKVKEFKNNRERAQARLIENITELSGMIVGIVLIVLVIVVIGGAIAFGVGYIATLFGFGACFA